MMQLLGAFAALGVAVVLLGASAVALVVPALRVVRVDPAAVLRGD